MKKIVYSVLVLIFCTACTTGNKHTEQLSANQEEALDTLVMTYDSEPSQECKTFGQNLRLCKPTSCTYDFKFSIGKMYDIYNVEGYKDGKCVVTNQAQFEGTITQTMGRPSYDLDNTKRELMRCALNETEQSQLADYYDGLVSEADMFSQEESEIITQKTGDKPKNEKLVDKYFSKLIENGSCIPSANPDEE